MITPTPLSAEEILAQNGRIFNWDERSGTQVTPLITADYRLEKFHRALAAHVETLGTTYGGIEKVEAIPGKWELDQNFSSILLRWICDQGVFMQEFQWGTHTTVEYSLVPIAA